MIRRRIASIAIGSVCLWLPGCGDAPEEKTPPQRVPVQAQTYWGGSHSTISWTVPEDLEYLIVRKAVRLPSGSRHEVFLIGPYEMEIKDRHGTVYRRAGDHLCLAWNVATGPFAIRLNFWGNTSGPSDEASDHEEYARTGGGRVDAPPQSADGQRFSTDVGKPKSFRVIIGSRHAFEWHDGG